MEINTFWKIVLKSIGLWLLLKCFYIVPQFFSSLSFIERSVNLDSLLLIWGGNLTVIIIFIIIIRIFLFKTQWIIEILKLDKHFNEQKIHVNISDTKLLTIVVIIIGALMFLHNLPLLFSEIIKLIKPRGDTSSMLANTNLYWTIYYFIIAIMGFVIMTNSKFIVKIIDKQTKNDTE